MRWEEGTIPEHGVRLHVRRVVDPQAPPVLLLHGLGVGGVVWQNFARRLLPHLAAVAPDLRGHGQSVAPPSGYAPADYAADLVTLIEALGLARPLPVVGHSLGALVAAELAARRPDLVSWLAVLDPPLDPDLRNPEVPEVYRLRRAPPGELETYLEQRYPGGGQVAARMLAGLFRQASDAAFEAVLDRPPELDPTRITVPCLLVQADPDRGGILGDGAAREFVGRLPDGQLTKLVGAPHAVHASAPGPLADALLAFGGYASSASSGSR